MIVILSNKLDLNQETRFTITRCEQNSILLTQECKLQQKKFLFFSFDPVWKEKKSFFFENSSPSLFEARSITHSLLFGVDVLQRSGVTAVNLSTNSAIAVTLSENNAAGVTV